MNNRVTGKMSVFGGPRDTGMSPGEGLALVSESNFLQVSAYFLPEQPPGTTGLGRRLNPDTFYIACRWDYAETPKRYLLNSLVTVRNPANGASAEAKPVDWGPAAWTGRVADLSPGLAQHLGLSTDEVCEVEWALPGGVRTGATPGAPLDVLSNAEIEEYFGKFGYTESTAQKGAILIQAPWPKDNLVEVIVPCLKGKATYGSKPFSGKVTFHRLAAQALQEAFAEVERKGLSEQILLWGGSYVPRHKNWDPRRELSAHSWGIALDLNVSWNGYGQAPAPVGAVGSVRELAPILEAHGFAWGGHFGTPDGMHFEYALNPMA